MSGDSSAFTRFLALLRERGFVLTPTVEGNSYLIAEQGLRSPDSVRHLSVDDELFIEYYDAAISGWEIPLGTTDRGDEVLSLMVTNVEAALESVDADGRNYVTELGLRRDPSGVVEWYQVEDSPGTDRPRPTAQPDPDLRWVAEPENPASRTDFPN